MPRYDWSKSQFPVGFNPAQKVRIMDLDAIQELPAVIWCDTDSGEFERHVPVPGEQHGVLFRDGVPVRETGRTRLGVYTEDYADVMGPAS